MPQSLVTGGAGFIGSNLALELERLGHTVVVADDFHSGTKENLVGFRGEVVACDLSTPHLIPGHFDYIFHQAAITDPRHPDDEETYRKNVAGFERILERAQKDNAKLIYASTAGLYGNGPVPMHEDQPKQVLTVYGKSKLKMDEMAFSLVDKMHIVGLRYFNVFGPREAHKGRPASMVYHLWHQMREGRRPRLFEWGDQKRDFIYVKDIVYANLCAMEGTSGVYNVGTGVASTFNTLISHLNAAMKLSLEPEYFKMPYAPETYQSDTQAATERAGKGIGFKAKWGLKEAVADYVSWLESRR